MTKLIYDVQYNKIIELKNEILSWHKNVADKEEKQIEKFVGVNDVNWFLLADDNDKIVSAAGIVEYNDEIYLNQLWAKSGYGKKMVDILFKYYKTNNTSATKFTFSAHTPKVIEHYKKNFVEYKFVGNNKWGFPTFERKF